MTMDTIIALGQKILIRLIRNLKTIGLSEILSALSQLLPRFVLIWVFSLYILPFHRSIYGQLVFKPIISYFRIILWFGGRHWATITLLQLITVFMISAKSFCIKTLLEILKYQSNLHMSILCSITVIYCYSTRKNDKMGRRMIRPESWIYQSSFLN